MASTADAATTTHNGNAYQLFACCWRQAKNQNLKIHKERQSERERKREGEIVVSISSAVDTRNSFYYVYYIYGTYRICMDVVHIDKYARFISKFYNFSTALSQIDANATQEIQKGKTQREFQEY